MRHWHIIEHEWEQRTDINIGSWGDDDDTKWDCVMTAQKMLRWCNHDITMAFRCNDKNMKHWGDD